MATSTNPTKSIRILCLEKRIDLPPEVQQINPDKFEATQKRDHPVLIKTLETRKRNEESFFKLDSMFSCHLAYLYVDKLAQQYSKELQNKAEELLNGIFEQEPDNLVALCIKYRLKKTKSTKDKIKHLAGNQQSQSEAYAVIAGYFYRLYMSQAAIALYERAISKWETCGSGDKSRDAVWKFFLAAAYRQQLNRNVHMDDKDFNPERTMERVIELLECCINLDQDDKTLAAMSYTDMARAYGRYQRIGLRKNRIVKLPSGLTIDICYTKACSMTSEKDPHVLELYGMYLLKTANCRQNFEAAAQVLEKVLKLNPGRHVSAHHLAQTYKTLWFYEAGLPNYQQVIFDNERPERRSLASPETTGNVARCDMSPAEGLSSNVMREDRRDAPTPLAPTPSVRNDAHCVARDDKRDYLFVPQHTPNAQTYYDSLRAENPVAKEPHKYLDLALHYLEMANKLTQGSRVFYLVGLARVCISRGDNEAAYGYFRNAKQVLPSIYIASVGDARYLYEQWGLLLSREHTESTSGSDTAVSEMSDDESNKYNERLTTIERYFLKSMRCAIKTRSRSRVAYYKLAEMLKGDKSGAKWTVLHEVYTLVGQHEKARALLEDEDVTQPEARKLLKQQCVDDEEYDKYLDLAFTAYKEAPDGAWKTDIVDVTLQKGQSMAKAESQVQMHSDYGEALKLCLRPDKAASVARGTDAQPTEKQKPSYTFDDDVQVFMACTNEAEVFANVHEFLGSCGIKVVKHCENSLDDLPIGCNLETEITNTLKTTQLVLLSACVDVDEPHSFAKLEWIVTYARDQCNLPVCIIQENQAAQLPKMWKILPCLEFSKDRSFEFMEQLFKAIGNVRR